MSRPPLDTSREFFDTMTAVMEASGTGPGREPCPARPADQQEPQLSDAERAARFRRNAPRHVGHVLAAVRTLRPERDDTSSD